MDKPWRELGRTGDSCLDQAVEPGEAGPGSPWLQPNFKDALGVRVSNVYRSESTSEAPQFLRK